MTAAVNTRLLKLEDGRVSFRYKDYAHGGAIKAMELEAVEFLRRVFTHVLPKGFVRVRHFGLFANRFRKESLARCRDLLGTQEPEQLSDLATLAWPDRMLLLTGHDPLSRLQKMDACSSSRPPGFHTRHAIHPPSKRLPM